MSVKIIITVCFAFAVQGSVVGWGFIRDDILESLIPPIDPGNPCADKSSFIRKDLVAIVDYIYDELKLNESISKEYIPIANGIQMKYLNQLQSFKEWFNGQPEQLKHIIEGLANRRRFLEPQIKKFSTVLRNHESLKEHIDQLKRELDVLIVKFKGYKSICDANCPVVVTRMNAQKDYYCGTAAEIKNISISELNKYVNTILKPEILKQLKISDTKYKNDIEHLEENIKDIALKDYGRLLVDILRLQDEYIHYFELFEQDIESYKNGLDEKVLFMEGRLFKLKAATEKYRKHCLQCAENSPILISWKTITDVIENSISSNLKPQSNLLNDVINSKTELIHQQSLSDIQSIFSDLDLKMEEIKQVNTNVSNFKPIQENIKNIVLKEKQSFDELKRIVSKESIESFLSLEDEASKTDASIGDTLREVMKLII